MEKDKIRIEYIPSIDNEIDNAKIIIGENVKDILKKVAVTNGTMPTTQGDRYKIKQAILDLDYNDSCERNYAKMLFLKTLIDNGETTFSYTYSEFLHFTRWLNSTDFVTFIRFADEYGKKIFEVNISPANTSAPEVS